MGGIGGDPTAEDVAKARELVAPNEKILGVYRIRDGDAHAAVMSRCFPLALPCFWPHAVACSPCLLTCYIQTRNALNGTIYVVTTTHIHRHVDPDKSCWADTPCKVRGGGGCQIPTNASARLQEVVDVKAEPPLAPVCGACFRPTGVTLRLYRGSRLANVGTSMAVIYTGVAPEDVVALIKDAQAKSGATLGGPNALIQALTAGMMSGVYGQGVTPMGQPVAPMAVPVVPVVAAEPITMERADDPIERIAGLKRLLDAGAIDPTEFDSKKAELMARL